MTDGPQDEQQPETDDRPKPGVNDPHPDGAGSDEPLTSM
jgi:hypothetical protein